jgi:hypothetical protein
MNLMTQLLLKQPFCYIANVKKCKENTENVKLNRSQTPAGKIIEFYPEVIPGSHHPPPPALLPTHLKRMSDKKSDRMSIKGFV